MNNGYIPEMRSFEDLFGGTLGDVTEVSVNDIDDFPGHPYKVLEDEDMAKLQNSIMAVGITTPLIVRRMGDRYELISGHRRKHAAKLAGIETVPVIIKDINDDDAVIAMVDSNTQRSKLFPSEKALSYKMKYEAIKHQGKAGSNSLEELSNAFSEGAKTVQRFIKAADLVPEMLQLLDEKKIGFSVAVTLSDLQKKDQETIAKMLREQKMKISGRSASAIKMLAESGDLTEHAIATIVSGSEMGGRAKKSNIDYAQYFPKGTPLEEIENTIISLLEKHKAEYQK